MLARIRDIAVTVMAVLVSLLVAAIFYYGNAARSAVADLGDRLSNPAPAATIEWPDEPIPTNTAGEECIGEEPPPGC